MERQVKGIFIPIELWLTKDLSWNEKILLMEIDSFTSKGMDCYFSNQYVADLLGIKENTASIIISKLIEKGYVKKTRFDGRHRYLETTLSFTFLFDQSNAGFDENQSLNLNLVIHNNIDEYINEQDLYKEKSKRKFFVKPTIEEIGEYCRERGNNINPEEFFDFYESKGWMVGKNHMKDWRAAVRPWERDRANKRTASGKPEKESLPDYYRKLYKQLGINPDGTPIGGTAQQSAPQYGKQPYDFAADFGIDEQ